MFQTRIALSTLWLHIYITMVGSFVLVIGYRRQETEALMMEYVGLWISLYMSYFSMDSGSSVLE
jgi:hypothetical protein